MTSVFSWQNSISLCPASFCTPRLNLPVTPCISRLPTFAFQSPIMKSGSVGAGPRQVATEQGPQEAILKELSRHEPRNQQAPGAKNPGVFA